jgi:hypothetical protein
MMSGLSCVTLMMTFLRLSLHIEILITDSIKLSLRNLETPLIIDLLALSPLLATYVHVVLLLILIMNVLNNYCMLLMILYGA